MKISILTIGDELLIGQVINTNASWLSEKLTLAGFHVDSTFTVGDSLQDILEAFALGLSRADVLLVTGGLGPTSDDRTREALCLFYKCSLHSDPHAEEVISNFFRRRGLPLTTVNLKQAEVPDKCDPVHNPVGTAPGMWFEENGKILIAMPGVPFEMKQMVTDTILPKLISKFNPPYIAICNVLTQGLGESFLSDKIKEWEEQLPGEVSLAYLPQPGIVRLRLMARGKNKKELDSIIAEQISKLNNIIPELIFGYNDDTIEKIIGEMMVKKGVTLSTAESCTGGYIAHLITSVPGSSRYYKGSVIAYDNEIKINELGVQRKDIEQYGAVSKSVVVQMAEGIRKKFATEYSIAVSGIAGPDGGTPDKPVGTVWIAVSGPEGTTAIQDNFGDNRERHIRRTSLTALNILRNLFLTEHPV
jgi:nicotinamide-nucleotide amidase